jgi:hypothetical protein
MWKAVLAGTTALALIGTSAVYAQQRQGRGPDGARRGPPTIEDMRAFGDARLAALKAGLTLTPDQEKNWPAFEQAARELAKLRFDRIAAQRERMTAQRDARRNGEQPQSTPVDPIERMRQRGTTMAETGTALKKLADATDPLYKSLDDSQKRRFAILGRIGPRDGRPGFRGRDDGGRDGMERGRRRTELSPGQSDGERGFQHRDRRGFERGQGFHREDRDIDNL